MSVPKMEVYGNIVSDPTEGTDSNGNRYIMARVGMSDSRQDKNTQQWETLRELFISVQAFRVPMDVPSPAKGDKVSAYGKVFQDNYTDNNGNERTSFNLLADYIRVYKKDGGNFGPSAAGMPTQQFNPGGATSPADFVAQSAQRQAQQQQQNYQQGFQQPQQQGYQQPQQQGFPPINNSDPWSTL